MSSSTAKHKIRVLLADDHVVMRQGLRALLAAEADIEIVGEADNGRQAIELACQLRPNVAILDIAMPNVNGVEAARQILRRQPATRVLILSSYNETDYIRQLVDAGAAGYLGKQTAAQELLEAIRSVHRGNGFFSPDIARRLKEQSRASVGAGTSAAGKRSDHLTTREAEVLQLIAEGRANKQIAADLGISIKTVEKHRQQVMNKLGIHDIAGLTRHAIARGMVTPSPLAADRAQLASRL